MNAISSLENLHAGDADPVETQEWLDALRAVLQKEGPERAHYLLETLTENMRRSGAFIPFSPNTAYINTIPPHLEERSPGDHAMEWKIRSIIRWNAMALVVNSNREHSGIGGHIASFASAATLYDVGFNHFWKGAGHPQGKDLIYIQGHSAPGIYSRAFLEGRLDETRHDALDAVFAGFPAGTVSGAPKVRACEIIAELEPETRGAYAGGVGYFAPDGSVDTCIVLRTGVVKDGVLHVQAGAGIVADSDPAYEQRECEAKAGALFAAAREAVRVASEAGFGQ